MATDYNIAKVLEMLFVLCSLEDQDGLKSHYFLNVCGYCTPEFVVTYDHNTQRAPKRLFRAHLRSLKVHHQDLKVKLAGPSGQHDRCFGVVNVLVQSVFWRSLCIGEFDI